MNKKSDKICIIGLGRLGANMAYNLQDNGYAIDSVVTRDRKKLKNTFPELKPAKVYETTKEVEEYPTITLISVKDSLLEEFAEQISKNSVTLENKVFLHFSGAHDSSLLNSLKWKGASIGSIHPLYSFPVAYDKTIPRGVMFTYEGDNEAEHAAKELASCLGGLFKIIEPGNKGLYHLAASFTANLSLGMQSIGGELMEKALGDAEDDYRGAISVLMNSVAESVKTSSWAEALNGPIKRGDKDTIDKHLSALEEINDEEISELYLLLKKRLERILENK